MTTQQIEILMIAGEASGDLHASNVVKELKNYSSNISFFGIGGEKMKAEGVQIVYHMNELSIIGFSDIVRKIPLVRSVERTIRSLMKIRKPKAVVLVDFPGLNLRIAKYAKDLNIPVFYYIAPQVWAWGKHRLKKIKKYVDEVFLILPFEERIYSDFGIRAQFVGHPILDLIKLSKDRETFCRTHNLDPARDILALFPGSREREIINHLRVMVRAANELKKELDLQPVIGVSQNLTLSFIRQYLPSNGDDLPLIRYENYELLQHSAFAFVKSGTTTLEAACFQTPMVVLYRTSMLNYLIGRMIVKVNYFSLVNILAGKEVVKELSQKQVSVPNLVAEGRELLTNTDKKETMKKNLAEIKSMLGSPGASQRVARRIMDVIQ